MFFSAELQWDMTAAFLPLMQQLPLTLRMYIAETLFNRCHGSDQFLAGLYEIQ